MSVKESVVPAGGVTAVARARRGGRARNAKSDTISGFTRSAYFLVSVLVGLAVWQFLAWRMGPALISSPQTTFHAAVDLASDGRLFESAAVSLRRILLGWSAALLVAVPLGILMAQVRVIRLLIDPYLEFFRFIPSISFITLAITWFGIGETSKIVLIFYTSVFILTINTIAGVLSINPTKLLAAATLGAGPRQIFVNVILPSTVPHIVTGGRLALGNSFLTIVTAEIVAAQTGLGALIWSSRNFGRIDWIFVGIITLGILGYLCDRAIRIFAQTALKRYDVKV